MLPPYSIPAAELDRWLSPYPPRSFERGEVLIEHTDGPPARVREPAVAYVVEGLVCGVRHHSRVAPESHAAVLAAGDGRWVGFEALQFGENLLRYVAMTPTVASVIPLCALHRTASSGVLTHMLRDVSLQWWTVASVMSLGCEPLRRRALLLLCDLRRLHARPKLELRQRDVADLLGVRRQTLQRVLKGLKKSGLVELGYAEITVASAQALLDALVAEGGRGLEGEGPERTVRGNRP